MIFGVKVMCTYSVGASDRRFYEEMILTVNAESYDDAYRKAEKYMQECAFEYTNVNGEKVKPLHIEAVDCFQAFDSEGDVQEVYSSFSVNKTTLTEEGYYTAITSACNEEESLPLRNIEFTI